MAILSTLESTTLDETISCGSKWIILTKETKTLQMVILKCATYAQPILCPWNKYSHFII